MTDFTTLNNARAVKKDTTFEDELIDEGWVVAENVPTDYHNVMLVSQTDDYDIMIAWDNNDSFTDVRIFRGRWGQ